MGVARVENLVHVNRKVPDLVPDAPPNSFRVTNVQDLVFIDDLMCWQWSEYPVFYDLVEKAYFDAGLFCQVL
jgi:hypothetical protein